MSIRFLQLNDGWNADPNAPSESIVVAGVELVLSFRLNRFIYKAAKGERGRLRFSGVRRYRLGPENDHAWFDGNGRYSGIAPGWGEFYEVTGDPDAERAVDGWVDVEGRGRGGRHFLFYLRDSTFEGFAEDWSFERDGSEPS